MYILDAAGPLTPFDKILTSPDAMTVVCFGAALILTLVVVLLLIRRKRK